MKMFQHPYKYSGSTPHVDVPNACFIYCSIYFFLKNYVYPPIYLTSIQCIFSIFINLTIHLRERYRKTI